MANRNGNAFNFNHGWNQMPGRRRVQIHGQRQGLQAGYYGIPGNPNQLNQPYQQLGAGAGNQIQIYDAQAAAAGAWGQEPILGPPVYFPPMRITLPYAYLYLPWSNPPPYPPAQDRRVAPPYEFAEFMMAPVMTGERSGTAYVERAEPLGMPMEPEISEELSDKVFENDMLREIILNKVIYSANGTVSTADLQNVRLVRKSWCYTAADSLRQRKLPLFHLTLDLENSTNGSFYDMVHGSKLLGDFIRSVTSPDYLLDFIPPFSLHLTPEFFRSENYKDLSDCLTFLGEGLINLDLCFPANSSLSFAFRSFYLPHLQRLSVHYSDYRIYEFGAQFACRSMYPLQIILSNVGQDLREVLFKHTPTEALIPFGFSYLTFPQSITKLALDCPLKDSDLDLLSRNEFPNLRSLSLFATPIPYSAQKIFDILDKFRTTLHDLKLAGQSAHRHVLNATFLQFPVMEELESLTIASQCWELEEEVFQLQEQLPKLKEVQMISTTEAMFYRSFANSVFPEVTKMEVSLVNGELYPYMYSMEVPRTLTLANMMRLIHAFPNVVELELTMREPLVGALKYLFNNMRGLQKLVINLKGKIEMGQEGHGVGFWDSLLTGLSEDVVLAFRRNPDCYEAMELRDDSMLVSIRKLTALKSLILKEAFTPYSQNIYATKADWPQWPLISDVAFRFALLKMPNLENLQLHGRFQASEQMTERWRMQKGNEINGTDGRD